MHGMNSMRAINDKEAKIIHHYKNTRGKLYKTYAAILFNKKWRFKQQTHKYIHAKFNGNNTRNTNFSPTTNSTICL